MEGCMIYFYCFVLPSSVTHTRPLVFEHQALLKAAAQQALQGQ